MTEIELEKFDNNLVDVYTINGNHYRNICEFVSAEDNDPLPASIIIKGKDSNYYEIYVDEIATIKQA